jgi:hypothetical protein
VWPVRFRPGGFAYRKRPGRTRDGRPAGTLTEEDRPVTPAPTTDDRPKPLPNLVTTPPPKAGASQAGTPPPTDDGSKADGPKADGPKAAKNPLVPLHEAIVAVGPGEVWKRVAESLAPLLQDWQADALKQKWGRLAAKLAAASTIAAGMAVLWDRGEKVMESDAGRDKG